MRRQQRLKVLRVWRPVHDGGVDLRSARELRRVRPIWTPAGRTSRRLRYLSRMPASSGLLAAARGCLWTLEWDAGSVNAAAAGTRSSQATMIDGADLIGALGGVTRAKAASVFFVAASNDARSALDSKDLNSCGSRRQTT